MTRLVTAFAACSALTLGVALQAQQPASQNPPQTPTKPEVTLTGCLIQGTAPNVFVFQNAKADAKSTEDMGVRYVVVASAEDLNLRGHLNHEVQITGETDGKPAPKASEKVDEKDLPKFMAKSVTMISNTCATSTR